MFFLSILKCLKYSFQERLHFAQNLIVFVPIELNRFGRTLGTTDTAATAEGLVDFADTVRIDLGHVIRAGAHTDEA